MVSNSEQIIEKTRNFQKVYAARTNLCKQTKSLCKIPYETGVSPTTTLSHWDHASPRKQSKSGRHGLSNIVKLQAMLSGHNLPDKSCVADTAMQIELA